MKEAVSALGVRGIVLLCTLLVFQGCATHRIEDRNGAHTPSIRERAADIADQPWSDLNLSRTDIPPLLTQASAAPYALPSEAGCIGLAHEINGLSNILGPDLQPVAIDRKGTFLSKKEVGDAGWGVARGFVTGFIPFRGIIRIFSGADAHEKAVAHVILAGYVRRAYLEGLEKEQSCPTPH